jgi:membrane dipeptidase
MSQEDSPNALKLHRESIVFDGHCDVLMPVLTGERQLKERSRQGHLDLPRMREGGLTAQVFAIFDYWEKIGNEKATAQALRMLDAFYQEMEANPDSLTLATTAADVERAKRENKVAAILGLEGAEPLEGDLRLLRIFHRLGVRNIGLTWNYRNRAADGIGVTSPHGLTDFGRALVREMNRLGIMVDIAHLAPPGVADVLALSTQPVISSHTGAYALQAHQRNLTDAQLEGIARSGGLVGVTFVPNFLSANPKKAHISQALDHIDYVARAVGVDYVGLGSDFDGYKGVTRGLEDVTCLPQITAGLLERGYTPPDVRKILGENFLRVFRQVCG